MVSEEARVQETWLRALGNLTTVRLVCRTRGRLDTGDSQRPEPSSNVNFARTRCTRATGRLWLDLGAQFIGPQLAPISGVSVSRPDADDNLKNEEPAVVLLDASVRAEDLLVDRLTLQGTVFNIAGTRWYQGGATRFPYPQKGRWFRCADEYSF